MAGIYYVERIVTWSDEYFGARSHTSTAWLVRAETPIEAAQKAARAYGDDEESFLAVNNNTISQMPNGDGGYTDGYRAREMNFDAAATDMIELF